MLLVIVLTLMLVTSLEIVVIIQVGGLLGAWPTVGLLFLISVLGGFLLKREGLSAWGRIQTDLASGIMPGKAVADGVLILFGGALMLTPGFLTDITGLLLLFPPSRVVARTIVLRRLRKFGPGGGPPPSAPI